MTADAPPQVRREGLRTWAMVGLVVFVVAYLRSTPQLVWEEPLEFWDRVPEMDALSYLVEPWAGYVQMFARASFLVAHRVDSVALTRVLAAIVIAGVALFLSSNRLEPAIPTRRLRVAFGLSLAFLPIAEPYVGPLNAQWWLGLFLVGMALTNERQWADYPVVALAGLSGVAACLALPAFRDRRGLVLLAVTILQLIVVAGADRRHGGAGISLPFVLVTGAVVLAILTHRLPLRTRLAYGWLSLVTLALGSWAVGGVEGGWRYLTPATAFLALVTLAIALRLGPRHAYHPAPIDDERANLDNG